MMGHGIGMVETIAGLDRFLEQTRGFMSETGHVLLDSLDVRKKSLLLDRPSHLMNA